MVTVSTSSEARPEPHGSRRACLLARGVTALAAVWLLFVVAHVALTGRWALWVVPAMIPPITFVVIPVALLLGALLLRARRVPIAVLAALALAAGAPSSGVNPGALTAEPGPGDLRVVSFNTDYFGQQRDGPLADHRDRAALVAYLRSLDADVLLLQEHQERVDGRPRPRTDLEQIRREFPGYEPVAAGTLLTLSRLPVVGSRPVASRDEPVLSYPPAPYGLRVQVRAGDRTLSIYNVHVPVQIVLEESPLTAGFYREINDRGARRAEEFRALTREVVADPDPVLVAGDFNTSPAMGDNRGLLAATRDAALSSADPYPVSWRRGGSLPGLWRLDWALTRGAVDVASYGFADPAGNSDHSAQVIDLRSPQTADGH